MHEPKSALSDDEQVPLDVLLMAAEACRLDEEGQTTSWLLPQVLQANVAKA